MAARNRVKDVRETEGLSQSQLANFSGVSEKTISRLESAKRSFTEVTKHKVVNGFNRNKDRLKLYSYTEVFP